MKGLICCRDEDKSEEVKEQGFSIWALYEKFYPEFTARDRTSTVAVGKLPLLGIQRSTYKPREDIQSR